MSEKQTGTHSGGIGFAGLLAIVFITLKLLGKIDWSWWWVLAPVWVPLALGLILLVVALNIKRVAGRR